MKEGLHDYIGSFPKLFDCSSYLIVVAVETAGKERVKEALHENWWFLKMNIVITPLLLSTMIEQGVMSKSMVDDVMVGLITIIVTNCGKK